MLKEALNLNGGKPSNNDEQIPRDFRDGSIIVKDDNTVKFELYNTEICKAKL